MQDANNVLKFIATNGLVANPSKTTLMFLNLKQEETDEEEIKNVEERLTRATTADINV